MGGNIAPKTQKSPGAFPPGDKNSTIQLDNASSYYENDWIRPLSERTAWKETNKEGNDYDVIIRDLGANCNSFLTFRRIFLRMVRKLKPVPGPCFMLPSTNLL